MAALLVEKTVAAELDGVELVFVALVLREKTKACERREIGNQRVNLRRSLGDVHVVLVLSSRPLICLVQRRFVVVVRSAGCGDLGVFEVGYTVDIHCWRARGVVVRRLVQSAAPPLVGKNGQRIGLHSVVL